MYRFSSVPLGNLVITRSSSVAASRTCDPPIALIASIRGSRTGIVTSVEAGSFAGDFVE